MKNNHSTKHLLMIAVMIITLTFKTSPVVAGPQNPWGSWSGPEIIFLLPLIIIGAPLKWAWEMSNEQYNKLVKEYEKMILEPKLSGKWEAVFKDIKVLNQYAETGQKIELKSALFENYNLTGAALTGADFYKIDWAKVIIKNSTLSDITFRKNSFLMVDFSNAKLSNVTFEDSVFNVTAFTQSELKNVKFIRCQFNNSNFENMTNSNLEFDHARFKKQEWGVTRFDHSGAIISFSNSQLSDVSLRDLNFPSSLTFENSQLKDIDMDRSKLSKLVMENVTGGGSSGFSGGNVAEVDVRNSNMAFGLDEGTLGKVSFINSHIQSSFNRANIKEFQIINCKSMGHLVLYKTKIDNLQISNCPLNDFEPGGAIIQNLSIEKSSIINSDFAGLKVQNLTLTDVSFDQNNDFSGAQVENLTTKNVTKLPGLNLNLTGSNVKF